jgi:hypothetical protein
MSRKKTSQKTGGPKTEEGRKRSAMNALRHGVLSEKMIVLQSEKMEYYDKLRREYYEELQPVGVMEAELVDEMIWAKWRQRRCITAETASIDMQMDDEAKNLRPDIEDALRTANAIKTLSNESNDLAHLSRYETRFHRMFHRAFRQLLELQDRRKRDGQAIENKQPEPPEQKLPNEPGPLVGRALACGGLKPANQHSKLKVIAAGDEFPPPADSRKLTSHPRTWKPQNCSHTPMSNVQLTDFPQSLRCLAP